MAAKKKEDAIISNDDLQEVKEEKVDAENIQIYDYTKNTTEVIQMGKPLDQLDYRTIKVSIQL